MYFRIAFILALELLSGLSLHNNTWAQEKTFIENFGFEAKPVITSDYLKQENFKYLSPENHHGLLERAFFKLSEGSFDEAMLDFDIVISNAPNYGGGFYGIGVRYKLKGDTTQASSFFKKSISKI